MPKCVESQVGVLIWSRQQDSSGKGPCFLDERELTISFAEQNNTPAASKPAPGGERKRVSIGAELLINPSVLFLDEVWAMNCRCGFGQG